MNLLLLGMGSYPELLLAPLHSVHLTDRHPLHQRSGRKMTQALLVEGAGCPHRARGTSSRKGILHEVLLPSLEALRSYVGRGKRRQSWLGAYIGIGGCWSGERSGRRGRVRCWRE